MKTKIAIIVLASIIAYDEWAIKKNAKNANEAFTKLTDLNRYLASRLDENEIPMTQYDQLVVDTIVE